MWNEVAFVQARVNGRVITESIVMQAAMLPLAGGSAEHFNALVEQLKDGR